MPGTALATMQQEPLGEAAAETVVEFDEGDEAAELVSEEPQVEDPAVAETSADAGEESAAAVLAEENAELNAEEYYAPTDEENESGPVGTEQDGSSDVANDQEAEAVMADEADVVIEEEIEEDEEKSVPANQEESTGSEANDEGSDNLCTVKFDLNGGVIADQLEMVDPATYQMLTEGTTGIANSDISLPYGYWDADDIVYAVSRDGYRFKGWTEEKDGTEVFSRSYCLKKDITLYAKWSTRGPTVWFDLNGGVLADQLEIADPDTYKILTDGLTGTENNTVSLPEDFRTASGHFPVIRRDGYLFAGWTDTKDRTDAVCNNYYLSSDDITLYALWEKAYTVEFDLNGGVLSDHLETANPDTYMRYRNGASGNESHSVELPVEFVFGSECIRVVTRDGYLFEGWTETKDGTDMVDGIYYPSKDTTLYAKWKKLHKVMFDLNGGAIADQLETADEITYKSLINGMYGDDSYPIDLPREFWLGPENFCAVERDGYIFEGWTETKDDTEAIYAGTYSPSEDITLYAKWAKAFTVKFDLNGGVIADQLEAIDADAYRLLKYGGAEREYYSVYLPTNILTDSGMVSVITRDGYLLEGWTVTKDDGENVYKNYYIPVGDTTLYAKWKKLNTITFDLNGGVLWDRLETENRDAYQLLVNGRTVTEHDYVYLPSEYWNGSETVYPVTREGYVFGGWTETKDGAETVNIDYYPSNDVTLYAKWLKLYTVKFDFNGGVLTDKLEPEDEVSYRMYRDGITVPENSSVYLREDVWDGIQVIPVLSRDGYLFDGWTETKDGVETVDTEYYPSKDITLYAKWSRAYTVRFDLNGGALADKMKTADPILYKMYSEGAAGNEKRSLGLYKNFWIAPYYYPVATRDGYLFDGWTEVKGSANVISAFDYYPSKDITLYAKWSQAYTVKFNLNGGAWNPRIDTPIKQYKNGYPVRRGESFNLPLSGIDRSGYELMGWTITKNDTKVLPEKYTATKDITLYAKWAKLYNVTLDAGSGKFVYLENAAKRVILRPEGTCIGNIIDYDNSPPKNGSKVFLGWYKDSALKYPVKRSDKITKNVTYYAKWSTNTYKITVANLKGANCSDRTTGKWNYGSGSYSFYIQQGDRIGDFTAWKNEENARFFLDKACKTKPVYPDYVPTANTTVYAKWYGMIKITMDTGGGKIYGPHSTSGSTSFIMTRKGLMCDNLPTVKKDGYAFVGWYDAADASAKILPASHVFRKNTTVKAKWAKGIKVTFKPNGGKLAAGSASVVYIRPKSAIGSKVPAVTRNGYVFKGWKNSVTNKVVTAATVGSEKPTKETIYTAVWTKPTMVSVTLQAGDGSFYDVESNKYLTKLVVKVPKNTTLAKSEILDKELSHDEYSKLLDPVGWSLTKNGSALAASYKFTKNVTLYPVWRKGMMLTVALVTNGGAIDKCPYVEPKLYTVKKGSTISLPTGSKLEKEGFTFEGWYTDPSFKNKVTTPTKFKVANNCYLFAKWKKR